jgi:flagellar basal body-associated protein FliL
MSRKKLIWVVVVVIFLAAGAAWFWLRSDEPTDEVIVASTEQPEPVQEAEEEFQLPDGWGVYAHEATGVRIAYPSDW